MEGESPILHQPGAAGRRLFSMVENGGFEAERRPGARDHLSVRRVATPWMALRGAEPARKPSAGCTRLEGESAILHLENCRPLGGSSC